MTSKWGTDTTKKFIELYKENVCLWNVDWPDYKSRPEREAAYKNVAMGMNMPGITVQDVKNKIKNLRSTYCQEIKKIEESKKCGGPVYEPSLKWLNDIAPIFLYAKNGDHSTANLEQDEDSTKEDGKKKYQAETYSAKRTSSSNKTPINKRQKVFHQVLNDEQRSEAYDAFGKSVAMQLKSLSQERALLAQSQIQTLLTKYGIADLKDRRRSNDNSPTPFTFVLSQEEEAVSPSSQRSNDGSVSSMPESKYFEHYPVELLSTSEDNL